MAWSDPKTWTADDLLTASDLNQYVSDNLSALYALVLGGGRKNLLHNGAMQVHQRVAVAATDAVADADHVADRWRGTLVRDAGSTWTATQAVEADAPTGSGFRKSLKVNITAGDASLAAGDLLVVQQRIEGQNLQTIRKGTASAEPLTLSFWTKSNKTGTYVAALYDVDNTRLCAATYTVTASATWEEQSITFPADLTGALDNDNADSFHAEFWLLAGSTYTSGTLATTWAAYSAANYAVGQTNLAADTNNYWMLTGVQLEVGSAATGFEFKSYGTELAECQRYYYAVPNVSTSARWYGYPLAQTTDTTRAWVIQYPVTMRAAPTSTTATASGGSLSTDALTDRFHSLYREGCAASGYDFLTAYTASADL